MLSRTYHNGRRYKILPGAGFRFFSDIQYPPNVPSLGIVYALSENFTISGVEYFKYVPRDVLRPSSLPLTASSFLFALITSQGPHQEQPEGYWQSGGVVRWADGACRIVSPVGVSLCARSVPDAPPPGEALRLSQTSYKRC